MNQMENAVFCLGWRIIAAAQRVLVALEVLDESIETAVMHKRVAVFSAYCFLGFHWLDRIAWQFLGVRRDTLMDLVRNAMIGTLAGTIRPNADVGQREADKAEIDNELDRFQIRFSRCASPFEVSNTHELKVTLHWDFGVWLAEFLNCDRDSDIIMCAAAAGLDLTRQIDALSVLKAVDPAIGPTSAADGKIVVPCQWCNQKMRFPVGQGRIRVTCPQCRREQVLTIL